MRNNTALNRFELEIDGHLAFADYRLEGNTLHIPHVEAAPALRGSGAAGQLMQQLMAYARKEQLTILPICSYAAAWMQRHPEYHDLRA